MKRNIIMYLCLVLVVLTMMAVGCGQTKQQGATTNTKAEVKTETQPNSKTAANNEPERKVDFISIGTAPEGASFYVIGTAFAQLIEKYAGIKATAEPTGASGENIRLMASKDSEMGFVMAPTAMKAIEGQEPFNEKQNLRVMFTAYQVPFYFITSKRSGIKTWSDLDGATIMANPVGSVDAETMFNGLLKLYNLEGKVKQIPVADVNDAAQQVIDGNADGIHYNMGAALQNLVNTIDVNFLSIDENITDKYLEMAPGVGVAKIPAGSLAQQDQDLIGTALVGLFMTTADMPEDVIYSVVKAIFEHLDEIREVHPFAKQIVPELAVTSNAPYHPGAIKYFKEIGVWKGN